MTDHKEHSKLKHLPVSDLAHRVLDEAAIYPVQRSLREDILSGEQEHAKEPAGWLA